MARGNRPKGFRALSFDHQLSGQPRDTKTTHRRRSRAIRPAAHFTGLEELEARILLTATPSLVDGILTCTGITGQANTINVVLSPNGSTITASVDGASTTCAASAIDSLVINAGSRSDSIHVDSNIRIDETLT